MTSVAHVLARARGYIMNSARDRYNRLLSSVGATGTSIPAEFAVADIGVGTEIEIGTERMLVLVVDTASKTLTVQRGNAGSAPAIHTLGDLIRVNPAVFDSTLFDFVNEELGALSAPNNGLYQIQTVDFTYSQAYAGYDLGIAETILDVRKAEYKSSGGDRQRYVIPKDSWRWQPKNDSIDFPTGNSFFLSEAGQPGQPVRVYLATSFGLLTGTTQTVESASGLWTEATDILSMGAALRATIGREITRNLGESQGDTRRAAEVPAGANAAASSTLRAFQRQRIQDECSRMQKIWGM